MSKNWTFFIIIAVTIMLVSAGYEIYKSTSGENVKFTKTVQQIPEDLNEDVLKSFYQSQDKIIIHTDNLNIN